MRPEEREELLASYALGSLSGPEAEVVEELVRTDASAAAQLAAYHEIVDLIALDVPLRRADPALRARLLSAARRMQRPRRRIPIWQTAAVAALLGVLAVTAGWAMHLQGQLHDLQEETSTLQAVVQADARRLDELDVRNVGGGDLVQRAELQRAIDTQQAMVAVATDPDVRRTVLDETSAGHGATGYYLWSDSLGSGVLVARGLPPLPLGEVYQVWLDDGLHALSAATFTPEPNGDAQVLIELDDPIQPLVVAVATAPTGGSERIDGLVVLNGVVDR